MNLLSFPEFSYAMECELYRVLQFAFGISSIHESDYYGRTALHYACSYTNPMSVRLFLEMGANPNHTDILGNTPLITLLLCCSPENYVYVRECCTVLLEFGANPNTCPEGAMSPLMLATYLGYSPITIDLLNFGADVNYRLESSLLFPARSSALTLANDVQMLTSLLQYGDCNSYTRFHALQKTTNPTYKALITRI
jgi:ankyrin repeat protein